MSRFPTTRSLVLAAIAAAMAATTADAALPPGYEDEMWCPAGSCDRYIDQGGMAGPVSMFHECYDPDTGETVDGVWTGSLTDTVPPEGWVEGPEPCADDIDVPDAEGNATDASGDDEEPDDDEADSSASTMATTLAALALSSLLAFLW